jgi:hypothetical protein
MIMCGTNLGTTVCNFQTELDSQWEGISYVGTTPARTLARALQCRPTSNQWVQLYVSSMLDIPTQKPDMEGIVSVSSCVELLSQRVVNTPQVTGYTGTDGVYHAGAEIPNAEGTHLTGKKLVIEGIIRQKVIYTALVDDQSLHSATFSIPFSTFVIVEGEEPLSQKFLLYPYLEDVFVCQTDRRSLFSNNTLFIKAVPAC